MNPIEIKIPFPKYKGMEVKNATIDLENGYSVVEYGEKEPEFKKGDIVIYCTGNFTIIGDLFGKDQHEAILYALKDEDRFDIKFKTNRFISSNKPRIATPSEQQILFDALAKDGKKWNAEKLCIENIEKDILVSDSIGIYQLSDRATTSYNNGDGLYISFNENKQLLCFLDKAYGVYPMDNYCYKRVQCKLTPCKREELKAGDTAFYSAEKDFKTNSDCVKILDSERFAFVFRNSDVDAYCVHVWRFKDYNYWYKVEPIQ